MGGRKLLAYLYFIGYAVIAGCFSPLGAYAASSVQLKVGVGEKMEATLYKPEGAGPFPAILVLHTSGGLRPADQAYAKRLADEGYVCLVPDFFTPYNLSQANRQM